MEGGGWRARVRGGGVAHLHLIYRGIAGPCAAIRAGHDAELGAGFVGPVERAKRSERLEPAGGVGVMDIVQHSSVWVGRAALHGHVVGGRRGAVGPRHLAKGRPLPHDAIDGLGVQGGVDAAVGHWRVGVPWVVCAWAHGGGLAAGVQAVVKELEQARHAVVDHCRVRIPPGHVPGRETFTQQRVGIKLGHVTHGHRPAKRRVCVQRREQVDFTRHCMMYSTTGEARALGRHRAEPAKSGRVAAALFSRWGVRPSFEGDCERVKLCGERIGPLDWSCVV